MADLPGISYMRTTREKTPSVYGADEMFPVGGSKTLRSSDADRVTLVGAGITVHEALGAAEALAADGIAARVLDCYSIKPIDAETLRTASSETGLVVTIEDHWAEGGLGDAVLAALAADGIASGRVVKIAVTQMPGSGTPEELRDWAGISADRIADRIRTLLS
jgi:transketolase